MPALKKFPRTDSKKKITIIGGGACAIMLGCELDPDKFEVAIYEKNAALGRKFLVAGEGGLNLSHAEDPEDFISKYTPNGFLKKSFLDFNNKHLITWLEAKGLATYVGSSGRVFPKKGIKPIEVLNVLLKIIKQNHVSVFTKHEWKGFTKSHELIVEHAGTEVLIKSDFVVFCLGGASWPVTGSTGKWADHFLAKNLHLLPFEASNCSFLIGWPLNIVKQIEGKALKNCSFTCGDKSNKGEVVLTEAGLEGGGIYPLSPQIRKQLNTTGKADLFIDFKPLTSVETLLKKLQKLPQINSYTKHVSERLNLNPLQIALLKNFLTKEDFLNPMRLVGKIKKFGLEIKGTGPLEDAISTIGGIDLAEIDARFELKKMPGHFAIGEMLNYDAPTGGYLLQSCFTMAKNVSDYLNSSN